MTDSKLSTRGILWVAVVLLFLYPASSWSLPREVTFFPGSAQVSETAKVKLVPEGTGQKKAIIVLPGQADPYSLIVLPAPATKTRIDDVSPRQVTRQNEERIAALVKQLEKLKESRRALQAGIRALDTQVQFWQLQTKAKLKTMADVYTMSAAISKGVEKAYQDKLTKESDLEKLDRQLKEAQDDLDRAAGRKETAWEVAILLSGSRGSEETITYTYTMNGCGWQPLYRLEAVPGEKQIIFTWQAEIWQSSGQDWNNVNINLATLRPPSSISPADMTPWIIKPRPSPHRDATPQKTSGRQAKKEFMAAAQAPEEAVGGVTEVRQTTYSLWQIGKRSIPAGAKQKVKIEEESWPSEFTYLARPSQGSQVFVMAKVKFPESKDIPAGNGLFVIDGAILGKRIFYLSGQEATVFFGIDPLVTSKMQLLSKKSGEKTFLQDKQTYSWEWRTDLRNGRKSAVKILVEEPNPQPRDERIEVTLSNEPLPTEKTVSALTWDIDIPPGQRKSILTKVKIEAPRNMDIDLGWRQ
ncbi:MAG TPA: mucoidy inhibitor MuiA family protein [Syntrophales bacterium]|nr:mucoidy inhibitor MuiA family protein [Syntrophales bacterium]